MVVESGKLLNYCYSFTEYTLVSKIEGCHTRMQQVFTEFIRAINTKDIEGSEVICKLMFSLSDAYSQSSIFTLRFPDLSENLRYHPQYFVSFLHSLQYHCNIRSCCAFVTVCTG